ncbi:uncharacterized protein TM35_000351730 [Trypanosoma theileri]|uniref:Formin n=1 Tax=Trypanosoma theileri TaxID=67003 RepID=A0A1X0NMQ6_9TRYP|nr:uncharacterized protein TM35_000351730 [Trypanosoma theileri]ORC85429.1 hypothetical protein TM35_000351730 [Trypanosoma theileri]
MPPPPPPPPPGLKKAPAPLPPAAEGAVVGVKETVNPPPPPPPGLKKAPAPLPPAAEGAVVGVKETVNPPPPPPPGLKKAPAPLPAAAEGAVVGVKETVNPPQPQPPPPGLKNMKDSPPVVFVAGEDEAQPESSLAEKKNHVPSLSWELGKLNGRGLPRLCSGVGVDGTIAGRSPSPFVSSTVTAVGDDIDVIGCTKSPVHHHPRDKLFYSPQGRVNDFSTTTAVATGIVGSDDVVGSNNPSVIRDNLLRLLEKLSHNRDGDAGRTGSSGEKEKGCNNRPHVDVDDALDDLFAHVISVLESIVQKFLFHSLTREWKSKICISESVQSSATKEYDLPWLLAWREAQCQDEEAWIIWKSALCRSWRRTRRECASRDRSEALAITLFQLDPLRVASSRLTLNPFPHDVERLQDERRKTRAKLHALICHVLYTCPVILIDKYTQRLAVTAEIDLDLLRRWILETRGNGDTEENIIGFIHALNSRELDKIDDVELTSLDEVERLFAAERRALLSRFDAGLLPPPSRVVEPVSSCNPPLYPASSVSPPPLYSTTALRRHVDPTPVELRPQTFTTLEWSPMARKPLEMEISLATRFASSPDDVMYPISTAKVEHETPRVKRLAGSGGRFMVWQQDDLKSSSASCSPHVRILDAERSVRQLPSALKSPRSLSSW